MMMEVQDEAKEPDLDLMEDETHLHVDENELLALRRVLHIQDSPYDKAQREVIFY